MVGLQIQLVHQLPIDRLNNLPNSVDALSHPSRQLPLLVDTRHSHQTDVVAFKQRSGNRFADIPFVSHSIQVRVLFQQFIPTLQVGDVGRNQLKIQDYPTQRDKQL